MGNDLCCSDSLVLCILTPRRRGIGIFQFCSFGYFLDLLSVFVPKTIGILVLVIIVVYRLSFF